MADKKVCFALGFFDGVHCGHRAILNAAREMAIKNNMQSGVFTYINHPKTIIGYAPPLMLTSADERRQIFKALGLDRIEMLDFSREFAAKTPEEFIDFLIKEYDCGGVCSGENFHFGAGGKGNSNSLTEICRQKNIECKIVSSIKDGDSLISSTLIRQMVESGDMVGAKTALNRPFSLYGEIIHGDGRGHKNGVPTINFEASTTRACPRRGVYATFVKIADTLYPAITNVGIRPTFYQNGAQGIESHLLDFSGDIYGKNARVYFCEFLRSEQKFDTPQALYNQIGLDASNARKILTTLDRSEIDELL